MKKHLRFSGKIALVIVGVLLASVLLGTVWSLMPVTSTVASGNDVVIYLDNNEDDR